MSETPLIDDQNQQELLNEPFTGVSADDDAILMSHKASRRLLEADDTQPEATVGGILPPTLSGENERKTKLRLTPRGKRVAGAAVGLTLTAATGVGIATTVAIGDTPPRPPVATTEVVVEPGDGGQSLMERGDPEVAAGTEDWRDALNRASHLPQNSEVLSPDHILKPGETITIPLDQPKQ